MLSNSFPAPEIDNRPLVQRCNFDRVNLASLTTDRSIDGNLPEIPGCKKVYNEILFRKLTYAWVEKWAPPMISPLR